MSTATTVMQFDSTETSFDSSLNDQYLLAKENGFEGTYQEYLEIRDYS